MDGASFGERVTRAASSELAALGGDDRVAALCDGDPTPAGVLTAVVGSEAAAAGTFAQWAASETDAAARTAFADVARQERDHRGRAGAALSAVAPSRDEAATAGPPGPLHAYLRGLDDTTVRVAAGMVGRGLASVASYGPIHTWFDARDQDVSTLVTDLRADTRTVVTEGGSLLDTRCASDADWEGALGAATYAIRVVCDDHADAVRASADTE